MSVENSSNPEAKAEPYATKTRVRAFCLKIMEDDSVVMRQRLEAAGYLVQMLGGSWTRREINRNSARALKRKKLKESSQLVQKTELTEARQRLSELTSSVAA